MKNRFWKKATAVLLAVSMTVQNGILTIAGDQAVTEPQNVVTTENNNQEQEALRQAQEAEAAAQRAESEAAAQRAESEAAAQRAESEAAAQRAESEAAAQRAESEAAAQRAESEAAAQRAEAEAAAQRAESEAAAQRAESEEAAQRAESEAAAQNEAGETTPGNSSDENVSGTGSGETQESEMSSEALTESLPSETESEDESETEISENESETEISGSESETEPESESDAETENETEAETEVETETEEAMLQGTVLQEVQNLEKNGETEIFVKYTIRVTNEAEKADSEHTMIKAVLPGTLTYEKADTQTAGLLLAANEKGGENVWWEEQSIPAASVSEYIFYAKPDDGIDNEEELAADFYIDDEKIAIENVAWINTELLVNQEQEEEEGPAFLSQVCGKVLITVTAEPGVLKPGTELNVKRVSASMAAEAIEGTLNENQSVEEVLAFDITLLVDGEEVQPDGLVQVSFSNISFVEDAQAEDTELMVAHVSDDLSRATEVSVAAVTADEVVIEAAHFSVYAVAVVKTTPEKQPITEAYEPQNSFSYTYTDDANGNIQTISSPAFDFHIFSLEAYIDAHTNGNIATGNLTGNGQSFGTHQNSSDGVLEYNYIGTSATGVGMIASGVTVVGSGVGITYEGNRGQEVYIGSNGGKQNATVSSNVYQESAGSEPYINISAELGRLSDMSAAMASNSTTEGVRADFPSDQNGKITVDISGSTSSVNYWNVTASQLTSGYQKPTVVIQGSNHSTLIINVDMTGADANALANLVTQIEGYNNSEGVVRSDCNLLWNFYTRDSEGNAHAYSTAEGEYARIGCSDYFMGTILAPSANVQYGALNGSVIAQRTRSNGQESHNWRYTGLSAKVTVSKTLHDSTADSERTFYFAVFSDAEGTQRVSDQRVKSVQLKDGETKSVTFSNLKVGVTYYIFETDASGKKISSGSGEYIITGNGKQVILSEDSTEDSVSIINSKIQEEKGSLKIQKNVTVNGNATSGNEADGTYHFTVKDLKGNIIAEKDITITNGVSNSIQIDNLDPGTYTVSETNPGNGITLIGDNDVTVTVTANNTANVPTVSFTNNKVIEKGSIKVKKQVNYNGSLDTTFSGSFTVVLFRDREDEMEQIGEARLVNVTNGIGEVTFSDLELGTYYVYELDANGDPVGDGYEYEVTGSGESVTVARGDLNKEVSIVNNKVEKGNIKVTKQVNYNGSLDETFSGSFTVALFQDGETGKIQIGEAKIVTVANGTGEVVFSDLALGTYYVYELDAEGDPVGDGYEYEVTGSGDSVLLERGDLNKEVTITNNKLETFAVIEGKKYFEDTADAGVQLTDGMFTFVLSGLNEAPMPEITEVTNAGNDFRFGSIKYLEAGEYLYTVTERNDGQTGIVYDETVYTVKVIVTEAEGTLSAEVIYSVLADGAETPAEGADFYNTYTAEEATAEINGRKVLTGRTLKDGEFSFQLKAEAGTPMPEETVVSNNADGSFSFGPITYKKVGTYTYTVEENGNPEDNTTQYDTTVYTFTVVVTDENAELQAAVQYPEGTEELLFTNRSTTAKILKVDAATLQALPGAQLQLLDESGTVIAEWNSTGEVQEVTGLVPGTTYILRETAAPDGYVITNDVTFVLDADGNVVSGGTNPGDITEDGTVLIKNTKVTSEDTSVTVVKTMRYNGLDMWVADLSFYAALYYDADCTRLASEIQELHIVNGSSTTATFSNLEVDRTYYVGECDASGNVIYSGEVISGVTYQARFTGTNGNLVETQEGSSTTVYLDNELDSWPDGFYAEGQLHITKKLLDADGAPEDSNEVFYAGIFSDPQFTTLADNVEYNILPLELAGGSEVTATTRVSLPDRNTAVTLYVTEVDANGTPVAGASGFAYTVTTSNETVTLSAEHAEEYVIITNQEIPETEEETETEFETETESEETETETTPKTGDTTDLTLYLLLMAGSAMSVLLLMLYRKKRYAK